MVGLADHRLVPDPVVVAYNTTLYRVDFETGSVVVQRRGPAMPGRGAPRALSVGRWHFLTGNVATTFGDLLRHVGGPELLAGFRVPGFAKTSTFVGSIADEDLAAEQIHVTAGGFASYSSHATPAQVAAGDLMSEAARALLADAGFLRASQHPETLDRLARLAGVRWLLAENLAETERLVTSLQASTSLNDKYVLRKELVRHEHHNAECREEIDWLLRELVD